MDFLKKYDPFKKTPLQDWKESVPVSDLSKYLKTKSDAGINLRQNDGLPCLCFDPGSRSVQIVEEVRVLFEDAMFDLIELINSRKIELPMHNSQSQCKTSAAVTNEAGPSAGRDPYGWQNLNNSQHISYI